MLSLKRIILSFFCCCICYCTAISQGNVLWSKNYGGSQTDRATALLATDDNALLLLGYSFSDNQDVVSNLGGADIWVLKTDLEGNILWSKTYGTTADDVGHSIVDSGNGTYIVAGTSQQNGQSDALLLQIDKNGNELWRRTFGAEKVDVAQQIITSNDGHFLVCGTTHSQSPTMPAGFGNADIWLFKVDTQGNQLWEKRYGGSRSDLGQTFVQLDDGSILIGGVSFSEDGDFEATNTQLDDSFILKTDANGNLMTSQKYHSNTPDGYLDLQKNTEGKVLAVGFEGIQNTTVSGIQGRYHQDILLQAVSPDGQVQWTKTYGGSRLDGGVAIAPTTEGGYLLCANTNSFDGDMTGVNGLQDKWVAKLSSTGIVEWQKSLGGSNWEQANALLQANNGHYYILGTSLSENGNLNNNKGNEDFYLTKIEGTFVLSLSLGVDVAICAGTSHTLVPSTPNCMGCSYLWNDGDTNATKTLHPNATTTYQLTITDQEGHTATDAVTLIVNPLPSVDISQSELHCFGSADGAITLSPTMGTPPFSYQWNTGATDQNLVGLLSGTYQVSLTDANGCTSMSSATLTEPSSLALNLEVSDIVCEGASTGAIMSTVTGGVSPYTYAWSDGSTSSNPTNLPAGEYDVSLTDANGCTSMSSATLIEPDPLVLNLEVADIACEGMSTGQIMSTVTGGTSPYTYAWSDGSTSSNLTNLPAGEYDVSLTDANGCTSMSSATLTEPSPLVLNLEVANIACEGASTGQIISTVMGGTSPYTYAWSDGSTSSNPTNLPAGEYDVSLTDANGCTSMSSATLTEPSPLVLNLEVADIACEGMSTGAITSVVMGGTSPYTYAWNDGNTLSNPTNLPAGEYNLSLTDANGCTSISSAILTEPSPLVLNLEVADIACYGDTTGQIWTTVEGGTPPYQYYWNGILQDTALENIGVGIYDLLVVDMNDCSAEQAVELTQTDSLIVMVQVTQPSMGESDGRIQLDISGGTMPYQVDWVGAIQSDSLPAGTYFYTITDANNCMVADSVVLEEMVAVSTNQDKTAFEVYPNPSSGKVFLQATKKITSNVQCTLFSSQGAVIFTQVLKPSDNRMLDLRPFAAGMYFLKIEHSPYHHVYRVVLVK